MIIHKDNLPDIAIAGYLGNITDRRKKRLEMHVKQTEFLVDNFPRLKITSYCSEYEDWEMKQLAGNVVDLEGHWRKHGLHNKILIAHYGRHNKNKMSNILFLDNDVVVWDKKARGISPTPCEDLQHFIDNPKDMGCPCMVFSCAQLRFDAFYHSRKPIINAPIQSVGWAMLVRSDLGVFYPKDTFYQLDDFYFRSACYEAGQTVLKHNQIFFSSLQRANDNLSTAVRDHDERVANRSKVFAKLAQTKPHLYRTDIKGRLRFKKKDSSPVFFEE